MSLLDQVFQRVATFTEMLDRLAHLGDTATAGPSPEPPAVEQPHPPAVRWADGWYDLATHYPAHPGRVGGPIRPWGVVAHTTDMLPDEFHALVTSWRTKPSDGACAHFLIGRDETDGLVQFVPITRNGNHAGGTGHGVYDTATAKSIHPNLVTVGIEIHCAGGVHLVNGEWRLVESGLAHGTAIPSADVTPDPQRPGRGWHHVTPYQLATLDRLLADLELVLAAMPEGAKSRSTGEAVPAWGVPKSAHLVGHVSLDPANRSDPWPEVCSRLFR